MNSLGDEFRYTILPIIREGLEYNMDYVFFLRNSILNELEYYNFKL